MIDLSPFRRRAAVAALALLPLLHQLPASAQDRGEPPRAAPRGEDRGSGVLALLPPDSVTEHRLATPRGEIAYTATAGTLPLFGSNGERIASVFYTAYVAKNAAPGRPLTFAFNGGPGAGSAYLHLGLVGPKILDFGPGGRDGANAQLIDNSDSWLGFTDLVLIDPIGTGWSRTAKPEDAEKYYGVRADAQVMAKVIALYVARNDRAAAPKFLLGESYGGFRAAQTVEALRQDQGILVEGVVMLSPLIEGQLIFGATRFPLGASLLLPSLAAADMTRRGAYSAEALAEAERFARTDYLTALAGPALQGEAATRLYGRVAALTGLPLDTIARERGFIRDSALRQLRAADGAVVSQYDATLIAPDPYPESVGERGPDPVLSGFTRAYGGAFAAYARSQLGFRTDMTYVLLAEDISGKWDWGGHGRRSAAQASASDEIREALSLSPTFRVLIAHGLTDLVTPYSASRYVIDHLPPALSQGRVGLKLYRGGHMFYNAAASRAAFAADARAFYQPAAEK
jgi:carboxypeptidase C (cathepsin A)